MILSDFGQTDSVQKQAGVQELSGPLQANASKPIWTRCEFDPACLLGGNWILTSCQLLKVISG